MCFLFFLIYQKGDIENQSINMMLFYFRFASKTKNWNKVSMCLCHLFLNFFFWKGNMEIESFNFRFCFCLFRNEVRDSVYVHIQFVFCFFLLFLGMVIIRTEWLNKTEKKSEWVNIIQDWNKEWVGAHKFPFCLFSLWICKKGNRKTELPYTLPYFSFVSLRFLCIWKCTFVFVLFKRWSKNRVCTLCYWFPFLFLVIFQTI